MYVLQAQVFQLLRYNILLLAIHYSSKMGGDNISTFILLTKITYLDLCTLVPLGLMLQCWVVKDCVRKKVHFTLQKC